MHHPLLYFISDEDYPVGWVIDGLFTPTFSSQLTTSRPRVHFERLHIRPYKRPCVSPGSPGIETKRIGQRKAAHGTHFVRRSESGRVF